MPSSVISADDIAACFLIKWVSFLWSLHWPVGGGVWERGGVSYLDLLILYEQWAGEKLSLEKAVPRLRRPGRCRFIGALCRSLACLPGRFEILVPCSTCANLSRHRCIGWERCGHGLTSRPRETATVLFWMSC